MISLHVLKLPGMRCFEMEIARAGVLAALQIRLSPGWEGSALYISNAICVCLRLQDGVL